MTRHKELYITDLKELEIAKKYLIEIEDKMKFRESIKKKFSKFKIVFTTLTRSQAQLKGYWQIIEKVRIWMLENGNNYSNEMLSTYFKMKANLYTEIEGMQVVHSLSNRGDISKNEMSILLETILDFAEMNGIKDAKLTSREFEELINYYDR